MRPSIHDDVALPSLSLADIVKDRQTARRLDNPPEAAVVRTKFRKPTRQTAFRQRTVLRTFVAVHPRGVVTRGTVGEPRRRRRIVFPAAAGRLFVLAGLRRLQQGKTKLALRGTKLLRLRGQRGN